jgi:hypothetical protein
LADKNNGPGVVGPRRTAPKKTTGVFLFLGHKKREFVVNSREALKRCG